APALDADPGADRVMDAEAKQVLRRRRWRLSPFDGFPKQQLELGPQRSELMLRRERDIDLQIAREQKHAIERRQKRQVEQVRRAELALQFWTPFVQDLHRSRALREPERQIQIRPAIAFARGERSHDSPGDDP